MEKPKTIARSAWRESWIELTILFAMSAVGATHVLSMHWLIALVVAPFIMFVILLGVMAFVQTLWMAVLCLERLGSACGFRKSPLS